MGACVYWAGKGIILRLFNQPKKLIAMNFLSRISRTFTLLVFMLIASTTYAQKFDVKWGDNAKMKFDFDDAVPLANGKFLILKIEYKQRAFGFGKRPELNYSASLVLVGADMATIDEKDLSVDENDASLRGFEKFGNNIYLMYSAYEKSSKTTSFYALKIDENTLTTKSKFMLGSFESDKKDDQATPTYQLSSDSSKVLLLVEGPWRKKENEKFYLGVFDTDLKKLWSKQIELPIEQRHMDIQDQDLTNDGRVFMAIKHYEKEVSRESVREDGSRVPSYVYKILVFSETSPKEKEMRLDVGGNFIHATKIVTNKDGSLTLAGLYKRKHNGNLNGAFYARIEPGASELKNPKMVEFPTDMLELVDKDNYATTKDKDPGLYPNFRIRHIMSRSNGSVDLISEYYKVKIVRSTDSRGITKTTYHYYFGDIVNTNIDNQGKAVFTRVPKNQKGTDMTLFLGYYPIIYNDKLIILYNDDEDNIERDLSKAPDDMVSFKKSVLAAAIIDSKGNLSRQTIYSHRGEDYVATPRFTNRMTDTRYLIGSDLMKTFKRRTRFGILDLK
jgi:hypothetical protein